MNFAKIYGRSVNSSNLIDDEFHDGAMPLGASGLASRHTSSLGALLLRAKVADGSPSKVFESGCRNLGAILKLWVPLVREKGRARKWCADDTPRDAATAEALYVRVAEASLAYWLDPHCGVCNGAKVDSDRRTCIHCKGTGIAELLMNARDKDIALGLVSEMEDLMQSHARRAGYALRDEINP